MISKIIKGVGNCGLSVELNIMDQYEITHLVERLNRHNSQRQEYDAYQKERSQIGWDARKEWDATHPAPEKPEFPYEELAKAMIFLNKLVLGGESKATVFEEETMEKGDEKLPKREI